jgi:siroheme synthase (precorrin-2 oxidase/ferrochelatase)
MGKSIRKTLEPLIKTSVSDLFLMQINLQDQLRVEAKKMISTVENRKSFLTNLLSDLKVNQLLEDNKFFMARDLAVERLNSFVKKNPNEC